MKRSSVVLLSGLLIACLSAPGFAENGPGQQPVKMPTAEQGKAQNGDRGQNAPGQGGNQQQGNNRQGGEHQQGNHQPGGERQQGNHQGGNRQQGGDRQANNGPRHERQEHRNFRQGRKLPPRYRGDGYQVNDWHQRGLHEPPHGQRWVNVDGNYLLIAIATGVITSIIVHQ